VFDWCGICCHLPYLNVIMLMVLLCFNFIYGIDRAHNLFVCVCGNIYMSGYWRLLVMPTCCHWSDNLWVLHSFTYSIVLDTPDPHAWQGCAVSVVGSWWYFQQCLYFLALALSYVVILFSNFWNDHWKLLSLHLVCARYDTWGPLKDSEKPPEGNQEWFPAGMWDVCLLYNNQTYFLINGYRGKVAGAWSWPLCRIKLMIL
jgi:hypothetical protein